MRVGLDLMKGVEEDELMILGSEDEKRRREDILKKEDINQWLLLRVEVDQIRYQRNF